MGALKKMLLLEYMDIHPHLPSEAKATTRHRWLYTGAARPFPPFRMLWGP